MSPPPPSTQPLPTPQNLPHLSGFQAVSVSAISEREFWVLGSDASGPAPWTPQIEHTVDGGASFSAVPAPPMVVLDGGLVPGRPLVFGIRFADERNGWVFGGQLWATHDGGLHWRQLAPGVFVDDLEPGANGWVYATFTGCAGQQTACTEVVRAAASSDVWAPLGLPGGTPWMADIGVHGDSLWAMTSGTSGALWISHDDGAHFIQGQMPCQSDLGGNLDPVSTAVVWAFCATGNFGAPARSVDGGLSFQDGPGGSASNGGMLGGISADRAFLAGGGTNLQLTTDGGVTYTPVPQFPQVSWIGFTDSQVGYLIDDEQPSGDQRLWRTTDSGADWSPVSLP